MRNGFSFLAVVGICFLGTVFCFQSVALSQCSEPACIVTSYIYTDDLEFDGCAGGTMSVGTLTVDSIWVGTTNFYSAFLDLKDDVDTHIGADEILDCGDVEGCSSKRVGSTSADASIQCTGQGVLSKGTAIVLFDETFAGSVDATKPVIVLVTPTNAACEGIAVVRTGINEQVAGRTVSGFYAVELNDGESDSTFNWQAIATRK